MIFRLFFSLLGAGFTAFGVFWVLQSLIHINQEKITHQENIRIIDFVRLERQSTIEKKERIKPEKPKSLPKPQATTSVKQENIPQNNIHAQAMQVDLDLDLPTNLPSKGILGDAIVANNNYNPMKQINTNVIPLSRVNPIYPRRARMMKVEGYVQTEFTITETGGVKDIVIIKSSPEGIFDNSAKRALIRWTFKPKMEDGKAVPQRAGITINYRLNQ